MGFPEDRAYESASRLSEHSRRNNATLFGVALYAVDLSLASKRIAVPTLDHDLILSNTALAVGNRAGVASLLVIKNLIGGGGVTVSASAPISPAAGNLWWDTSGNPDAGLKIRIGSSWLLVVTGIPTLPGAVSQAQAEAGTVTGTRLWSPLRVAQAIAALAPSGGGTTTSNADIDLADRLVGAQRTARRPRSDWSEAALARIRPPALGPA